MSREDIIKSILCCLIDLDYKGDLNEVKTFMNFLYWHSTLVDISDDLLDKKKKMEEENESND